MENKWVGKVGFKKGKMFQKEKFKQNMNLPSYCHLNIFTNRQATFESSQRETEGSQPAPLLTAR